MKHYTGLFSIILFSLGCFSSRGQVVTNISANYHDGQVFVVWNNIPNDDTGFYYVYKSSKPIKSVTSSGVTYLGRVTYNFALDYRFSLVAIDQSTHYLITNDNPYTVLNSTQNLFVYTAQKPNDSCYFAVCSAFNSNSINTTIVSGSNATKSLVLGQMDAVRSYLQQKGAPFPGAKNGETMDVYLHYVSNEEIPGYPAMTNEGCLPYHFGITKEGPDSTGVACYLKFHGGGGSFVSNQLAELMTNTWKVAFDDWIPAFGIDPVVGDNTHWLGYNQYTDIYKITEKNAPIDYGIVKTYTVHRVNWEMNWIIKRWVNGVDTTKMYLIGTSEGDAAVLVNALTEPSKWAAGTMSDPKLNVNAPEDGNPKCKYDDDNSGITNVELYWGDRSVNLYTDLPIYPHDTSHYRIYNLTNGNYLLAIDSNRSAPFLEATSGKNDVTTCWQEKPVYYQSVNTYHAGGNYFWDLRSHGGSGTKYWPNLPVDTLQLQFATNISYPAFSNGTLNGNPGSSTVTAPPYYNGDDFGTINGNYEWINSSIVDSATHYKIDLYLTKLLLLNNTLFPTTLPEFATTDVTLRRTQFFKSFAPGTDMCWSVTHRGVMVQDGSFVLDSTATDSINYFTIHGVQVYADTSTLGVFICGVTTSANTISKNEFNLECFPNPFSSTADIYLNLPENLPTLVEVVDISGKILKQWNIEKASSGVQHLKLDASFLPDGAYIVRASNKQFNSVKLIEKN